MTDMRGEQPGEAHVVWERLSELVDGILPEGDAADAERHIAQCPECRATRDAIRALSAEAGALPDEIAPPAALWGDIAATIAAGGETRGAIDEAQASSQEIGSTGAPARERPRVLPLPSEMSPQSPARWTSPRWLAAAAVVLMALSSGVTALFLRSRQSPPSAAAVATATGGEQTILARALPASFTATESAYLANVAELHALFVAQRSSMSPETVLVVERALATIDAAIAEARQALLADPRNDALSEMLSANYRQKVELLRRAAEFPHSL